MKPFKFQRPKTVSEAVSAKSATTQFVAGGTNLLDLMKKQISEPDTLVDITALSNKITLVSGRLRIDAMARNTAVTLSDLVLKHSPLLARAILAGASPQIRNMASVGGNLLQRTRCPYFYDISLPCNKRQPGSGCGAAEGENRMQAIIGYSNQCVAVHPSDMCVALAALDAKVMVANAGNSESAIDFKDFHRLPGETPEKDNNLPDNSIITAVEIPGNAFNKNFHYLKVRDRDSYAFALVSVAAALQLNGDKIVSARLASGGVAHKPWRWMEAEKFLEGKTANAATFKQAAGMVVKDVKPLSQNKFKVPMLQGAVEVALQNCITAK